MCEYYEISKFAKKVKSFDKNKFILIGLNIDGFKTNFDNFRIFANELSKMKLEISCFGLCETNILDVESDMFYIDGYNTFILDKLNFGNEKFKKKGSGIAIYLTKKINNASKDSEHCLSTPDIEILTVSFITEDNVTHYIIAVYRSPSGNFDQFIEHFDLILTKLNKHNTVLHIIGDFNTNLYNTKHNNCKNYIDCLFSNSIYPIISRATHFQGVNPTCIDHVLTNKIENIRASGVIPYNITHHMPIFSISDFKIPSISDSDTKHKFLCVNDKTIHGFKNDFDCKYSPFEDLDIYSAKDSFHKFTVIFKELYDKWFLHDKAARCNNVHVKSEWITPALAKSSETKNNLYQNWRKHRTTQNWNLYITYRRKLDSLKGKVKYDYYNNKFLNCKNNTKKVWQLINHVLGRKKRNSVLHFKNDDAGHNFNKYFTSIASNLISKNYPLSANSTDEFRRYLKPQTSLYNHTKFEISDLKSLISGLNNNKSTY